MVPIPLRVMVVDDHVVVRTALATLVAAAADMVVCGDAATVKEAEDLAQEVEPDVVIVDLHLRDGTGIGASRRIRDRRPRTQVILLTAASDPDALYASILAGAAAFLPKQLRGIDLLGTIRAVAGGARLLDQADIDEVVHGRSDARLLSLLAAGRTDRDLQRILGIGPAVLQERFDRLMEGAGPFRSEPAAMSGPSQNRTERATGLASA